MVCSTVQLDQRHQVASDTAIDEMARPQVVLCRVASIEDIRVQVVMLCQAESLTGQELVIDGDMPGDMH